MSQGCLSVREVFVGRQPIYTRQLDVFAYELLFRSGEVQQASFMDGNQATAHVLVTTFLEIGLDAVVGPHVGAFVNFTRDLLLHDYSLVLPPGRVVFEVLENVPVDVDLLEMLRRLAAQGYTIALDDFLYHDHLQPLVELADIVKLDVLATDRATLAAHVQLLRQYDVQLLAEKVETQEDFAYCKDLGFTYFQGYFLCRPDLVKGQRSPTSRLTLLTLLAKLHDPQVEFGELEALISRDASLSYKVLRMANAACYAQLQKIDSIHQALVRLGLTFLTTIVSLVCLANIDDKPHELLIIAMVRAKMCERLAQLTQQGNRASLFTVGLFSVLDALLDRPMSEILQALPLAEDLTQALLHHQGVLGATLHCVLAYERGQWDEVITCGMQHQVLVSAYLEAIAWANETSNDLTSA